jgi:hypothetical protein
VLDKREVLETITGLDKKLPLAGEFQCLAKMNEVPHMSAGALLSSGDDKHQPVILLQGKTVGLYRGDYVFTPSGFYANPYKNGAEFSNRNGEHHVEIPGGEKSEPQYYFHAWSPTRQQYPFVQDTPIANSRVKLQKLDASTLTIDPESAAMQELHKTMLKGTRNFRTDFESQNPRFRSPETLAKVRAMIATCKDVPGMQPELSFFENFIFRPEGAPPIEARPESRAPLRSGPPPAAQKGGSFRY